MYELYMGNILCPVTPSKLQLKIKNQNKTMNLISGQEINVLNSAGLTEVSYDLLLPNVQYPFAVYKSGFVNAKVFLDEFEKMKVEKKSFQFKLIRTFPDERPLYDTNMSVSLEDYTIKEDAKQGFDVVVSIKLKQFPHYGTKLVKVSTTAEETIASVENVRETENSPAPSKNSVVTHVVKEDDSFWNIAKKYYDDGSKHTTIREANKDKVQDSAMLRAGQILTIPAL